MIRYFTSDGTRVSQALIDKHYRQARHKRYSDYPSQFCHGCGLPAQGSAHIIPQARCKTLHKTELIWNPANFFPACHHCNQVLENPKGDGWKELRNIQECLEFLEKNDPELFTKFNLQLG